MCSALLGLTASREAAPRRTSADVEAVAPIRERRGGLIDRALPRPRGHDEAELVAAQPVRAAPAAVSRRELRAEAGEQGVTGRVAERVVVPLEAVEVEEHQQRSADLGLREESPRSQQPAAVAEAGERVRDRLVPAESISRRFSRKVSRAARRRRAASSRPGPGRAGRAVEVVVDEHAEREERADRRDGEERCPRPRARLRRTGPTPTRRASAAPSATARRAHDPST